MKITFKDGDDQTPRFAQWESGRVLRVYFEGLSSSPIPELHVMNSQLTRMIVVTGQLWTALNPSTDEEISYFEYTLPDFVLQFAEPFLVSVYLKRLDGEEREIARQLFPVAFRLKPDGVNVLPAPVGTRSSLAAKLGQLESGIGQNSSALTALDGRVDTLEFRIVQNAVKLGQLSNRLAVQVFEDSNPAMGAVASGSSDTSETTGPTGEALSALSYVTPEQFGACGDGTHDDAPALRAALESGKPVLLTRDLWLFSQISVVDKDVFFDGRGFTLHCDGAAFRDLTQYKIFINFHCSFDDENTGCELSMVTEDADTVVGTAVYKRGYVSYRGLNPTPTLETYESSTVHRWHEHHLIFENVQLACKNVDAMLALYADRYCHSVFRGVRVFTEPGHDGGSGIGVFAGYDFNITGCYVCGFAGKNAAAGIYHSLGAGIQFSGTFITISDCVVRNCRAELMGGASRNFFDCGTVIQNIVLERDDCTSTNRLFDLHAASHSPLVSNVSITIHNDTGTGMYAILWRCPQIYVHNMRIHVTGGMCGLYFGELCEEVHFNGLWAEGCDISTYGASEYLKLIEINNGIVRRVRASNASSALIRMRGVTIRDLVQELRNGWFENCHFKHEIHWSQPTITATASLTLLNCLIEGEHQYWYVTTPLIKAPKNAVTMIGCKLLTDSRHTTFSTTQTDVSGTVTEDINGIRLGTERAVLGANNLF